jgi:hypothetical protein
MIFLETRLPGQQAFNLGLRLIFEKAGGHCGKKK